MDIFSVAVDAAKLAGKLVGAGFNHVKRIEYKGGNTADIVTNVDKEAERLIRAHIAKEFPDHTIEGEEFGLEQRPSRYSWIIDPIDGTTNFSRGLAAFGISIGVLEDGVPIVGVVYNPVNEELYAAERGKGATVNGVPIHVSDTQTIEKAFVVASWWSRDPKYKKRGIDAFVRFAQVAGKMRSLNGTVFDLCKVASGAFDLDTCDTSFLDIAASIVILKEAGGIMTDLEGMPVDSADRSVRRFVAANQTLHTAALLLLNA